MLIEIYKGVEIFHDASKDFFYTKIVINKRQFKKDEVIQAGRLQATRDEVDKFLNTSAKKSAIKKAWLGRERESFELVEIFCLNAITGEVMVKTKDGKVKNASLGHTGYREERLFLQCKENDAIIANLQKKAAEIEKIKKETSCSSGKLLPAKPEHFV